jgi:hypothetical protein
MRRWYCQEVVRASTLLPAGGSFGAGHDLLRGADQVFPAGDQDRIRPSFFSRQASVSMRSWPKKGSSL